MLAIIAQKIIATKITINLAQSAASDFFRWISAEDVYSTAHIAIGSKILDFSAADTGLNLDELHISSEMDKAAVI